MPQKKKRYDNKTVAIKTLLFTINMLPESTTSRLRYRLLHMDLTHE